MTQTRDFNWYVARLDLARWEDQAPGQRSGFFGCPVHGGSDSLHVTEKNGRALLKCFACDATTGQITEALESAETPAEEPAPVRINRRRRGASGTRQDRPEADGAGRGVRPPAASTITPMQWMAERCGLTLDELRDLKLPLGEDGGRLVFEFPDVNGAKLRGIGEGKKGKEFMWAGTASPPFWPMPDAAHLGDEIVICEGEADAICLRQSGYEAYSVTKGSKGDVGAPVWDALRTMGVRLVRIVFDMDDAGRQGRADAAEGARAAGIQVRESRVQGIQPLAGETDARDVVMRQGYPLVLEADADEDNAIPLTDIEGVMPEPLLIGRLHATEHTIMFGDGGVGKGVIAAWWVAQLTTDCPQCRHDLGTEPINVLIVDYEQHARFEWRPRVEAFGGNLDRVFIVQPIRPIWEIAAWIKEQCELYSVDYVIIDSVAYACVGEEAEKSTTAVKYSQAIAVIGMPTLSLAHVTKEDADPNHPFGSIFWSNGARQTIAAAKKEIDDPASPRVIRNAKTNQRAPFKTTAIPWNWLTGPLPGSPMHGHRGLEETIAYKRAADAIRASMAVRGRKPTTDEVLQDTGMEVDDGNIKQVFSRTHMKVTRIRAQAPDGETDGQPDPT